MNSDSLASIDFRAMGCHMLAAVDAAGAPAMVALAQIPERFESWEQCLSRFRHDSELAGLNRQPGKPVRVSATLWRVARLAIESAFVSDGLVTPTVLDALEAAGYDHSLAEPTMPCSHHEPPSFVSPPLASSPAIDRSAPSVPDWHTIKMDARRRTITLAPGVRLDLAGVAKGWAADWAVKELARYAPALLNASGDIAVSGARADGSAWPIGIDNPTGTARELPLLLLDHGGVATSTLYYRRWLRGGRWQHHIIDPRTGRPAESDILSATVVAPSAAQAEVAAKVALILGSADGMEWIEQRPHLAALFILKSGEVLKSERLKSFVWREA